MRPGPPLRRVVQAVAAAVAWMLAAGVCLWRSTQGSRLALVVFVGLLAGLVWALDAFVPAVAYGAIQRGAPGSPPRVALTFDDGPSQYTPSVLAALERAEVRATFFVLGQHVEQHPELVRAMVAAGHVIGNHTYSHRVLALCRASKVTEEIARTDMALARAGVPKPKFFRAPRGFQGPIVRAVLRRHGLRLIAWTRGAWDSERREAAEIAALAAADPKDGDILLLHDGAGTPGEQRRDRTAEAVPLIVEAYRSRGFRFVTVPEILEPARV